MAWMVPCKHCPRQGCGSYHDSCPDYKKYLEERKNNYDSHLEQAKNSDILNDMRRDFRKLDLPHKNYTRRSG